MPPVIRLTPHDAERYALLRREMLLDTPWAFAADPSDDVGSDPGVVAERLADPENAIFAVESDDGRGVLTAAAGIVCSTRRKTRHRATVWGVYTTPSWRGRGQARAVVAAAIDAARAWQGVEVVGLSVSSEAPAALALYESLDFVRWGVEPDALRVDGRSYDEIHLALRL